MLYLLPLILLIGGLLLSALRGIANQQMYFGWFTGVQFFRYITFEIAFSPIYQMFFASIEKERRGRAKTFLEGFIKPGAMITSGLVLIALNNQPIIILAMVVFCSIVLIIIAFNIRRVYVLSLIPGNREQLQPHKIYARLSSYGDDSRLMEIIGEYSKSPDIDMRIISVKLLAGLGSKQALEYIIDIYKKEDSVQVKENIARSL